MSENPNEVYGDGVLVSGVDVTWFRECEPGEQPYPFILVEPFGDGTST